MAVNQSVLEILIRAKDEASAQLNKISGFAKKNEDAFKGMAAVGGTAFVGLTALLVSSVSAAADAERGVAQLGAVLASTGGAAGLMKDEILAQADALSKLTVYEDDAILGAQNLLLTFTQVKGPVFKDATATILDMSTALGQDLKTSAMQVGKALNDPIAGVGALRKVGVSLTEQQEEQIKTMVALGDVAGAQGLILKELAVEFGGSAAAEAATFEGQLKMLMNTVGELKESIGGPLLGVLVNLIQFVKPVVESLTAWVEENPKLTTGILVAVTAIAGLVTVISLLAIATTAFTAVAWPVVGVVGLVAAGIIALIAVIVYLGSHLTELKEGWMLVFTALAIGFSGWFEKVKSIFKGFADFVKTLWETVTGYFKAAADKIKEFLQPVVDFIDDIKEKLDDLKRSAAKVMSFFGGDDTDSGKALGGTVMAGGSYVVGERGPELFTPGTSGNIGSVGGGGQSVQVIINGGIFAQDPHEMAEYLGDLMVERFQFGGAKL